MSQDTNSIDVSLLQQEHASLSATIRQMEQGPAPDSLEVRRAKRRKLLLKEQIIKAGGTTLKTK